MKFIEIDDAIINLESIADATFDADHRPQGDAPGKPTEPRLSMRYLGMGPNGHLITRTFHGDDALRVRSFLRSLCVATLDTPTKTETEAELEIKFKEDGSGLMLFKTYNRDDALRIREFLRTLCNVIPAAPGPGLELEVKEGGHPPGAD